MIPTSGVAQSPARQREEDGRAVLGSGENRNIAFGGHRVRTLFPSFSLFGITREDESEDKSGNWIASY